MKNTADPGAYC